MHRKPNVLLLLGISFGIFLLSYVLDQAIRWSDPWEGAFNGLLQSMFTGFAWILYVLPLSLGINGLYRWRRWERGRTWAVLAPAFGCTLLVLVGFAFSPPTAEGRLRGFTGAPLPPSVRSLRTHFTGGGLSDYDDIYYFECSAADTDQLIAALGLSLADQFDQDILASPPFLDWPNPAAWVGRRVYRGGRDHWFYYLATDASREHVYLIVGCT